MDHGGSFRVQAEAAVALVQWKALFAEQVAMQAQELAKQSGSDGVITLGHYRQAASLAVQVLATAVQDTGSSNGLQRQRDCDAGQLHEAVSDWFRQFVKHLELYLVDTGRDLPRDAECADYGFAAMRALKLTLRDSGLDADQIINLFARVAFEDVNAAEQLQWNAELNRRRFQLIDGDIQGKLSAAERLELAALTQLMREHVDSEANLPLEGARKLHRRLTGLDSGSTDSER